MLNPEEAADPCHDALPASGPPDHSVTPGRASRNKAAEVTGVGVAPRRYFFLTRWSTKSRVLSPGLLSNDLGYGSPVFWEMHHLSVSSPSNS